MKKIVALIVAIIIVSSNVFATSTSIKNQLKDLNSQQKDAKNELNQNQADQKDVLKQIDKLDQNINTTETQIENTKNEISRLEKNIKIAEENIDYMQKEYDKKFELRKERVKAYYKNGSTSLRDIAYKTDDPTEIIYREKIIEKILKYDDDLMTEINEEKESINEEKIKLEEDKVACANLKSKLDVKLAGLNETVSVKTKYLTQLKTDQKDLERSIDEIQKKADELEAEFIHTLINDKMWKGMII